MFTIKLHILHYVILAITIATWIKTTGEATQISILIGALSGVIFILADVIFQMARFNKKRRMDDVEALNVNFSDIHDRLKELEK